MTLSDSGGQGLLVKPEVARRQMEAERSQPPLEPPVVPPGKGEGSGPGHGPGPEPPKPPDTRPRRFHGTVTLDATRVGRDAGRIAEEVIAHLAGLVGARVTVTLEVEAEIPSGAPDHVVRTVTENSRTLRFKSHGFEKE